jgi:energy-coupling factor transporter ATP-binding protein EcfA2
LELHIPAGQRVLLTGPSGAGKSTLLRALAGLLLTAEHGELSGRVTHDGRDVAEASGRLGLLLQDPKAAVVAQTVGRDVAFGLENLRIARSEIWPRVESALTDSGFPFGIDHPTGALSGGETQRLALAGSLVLDAALLLLDEPTSMLDPRAADTVRSAVRRFAELKNPTVVIVEHRLDPWLDFADRLIVLGRDGSVVADGEPRATLAESGETLTQQGVWIPGRGFPEPLALDPALVRPMLERRGWAVRTERATVSFGPGLVRRHMRPTVALSGVSAQLRSGEALAVTGPSGSGKSTLAAVLAGLQRPTDGKVLAAEDLATTKGPEPWRWRSRDLAARLAWVPQIPEQGIVTSTVLDEVMASTKACGGDAALSEQRARGLLDVLGLTHVAASSPYHLSGGEQRRLMLAAALCHGPSAVLLDEPTVGQDRATWAVVIGAVATTRDAGTAVAVATHDEGAVEALADHTITLAGGVVA